MVKKEDEKQPVFRVLTGKGKGLFSAAADGGARDATFFRLLTYGADEAESERRCPQCGCTYSKFQQTGLVGCARCYTTFYEELVQVLQRVQGAVHHPGKVPNHGHGVFSTDIRVRRLYQQLQAAVRAGRSEEAARIREEYGQLKERMRKQ